ncbi:MAG: hypothetical protein JXR76_03370 [Deltaproteobacteria bacterium]|nr:hypothetical protein [Deltaproteobacteria bacterium]
MTHPKLKIAGTLWSVALGVMLGWLTLEWLLNTVEGDKVRLVSEHLGTKLWMQLKFALLSALVGASAFWGAVVGRRWNVLVRLMVLFLLAIGIQWAVAVFRWMQIAATIPEGTEDMPATVYLGNLGTGWVPIVTAIAVWVCVVPLLFGGRKPDDSAKNSTEEAIDSRADDSDQPRSDDRSDL